MTTWNIVGATGHRPQHLQHLDGACKWAREEAARVAVKVRDEYGCTMAVSGLALGWDQWFAQAALNAGLALWAHIPFEDQAGRWTVGDQREWQRLREAATKVTVYGANPRDKREATQLLMARNNGMISASDAMVCLWLPGKRSGGTWAAVRRIKIAGMPAIHLDPAHRTVRLGLPDLTNGGSSK